MVVLRSIKREGNEISADYYPEGKDPKGHMRILLPDGSVIQHEPASMFAAPHVKLELLRMARLKSLPDEKTVMWY